MNANFEKVSYIHDNELTHSMVHYLFAIHKLKERSGYARVTDIAREMNLTKGSVSIALNSLKKKELITENESKFFALSEKGHQEVHNVLTSRTLLYYFLRDFLGVSEEISHRDSCLMEHLMSEETRNKFFDFMKKLSLEGFSENINNTEVLNLEKFTNYSDFVNVQAGDSYLQKG